MAVTAFLDTSVLPACLIDFGPQSAPATTHHATPFVLSASSTAPTSATPSSGHAASGNATRE